MSTNKVVITTEGGIITSISSTEDIEVMVIDRDDEGVEENEILSDEEIEGFVKGSTWKEPKKYISGVSTIEIPIEFEK